MRLFAHLIQVMNGNGRSCVACSAVDMLAVSRADVGLALCFSCLFLLVMRQYWMLQRGSSCQKKTFADLQVARDVSMGMYAKMCFPFTIGLMKVGKVRGHVF